jgi:hypothetical protein
VTLSPAFSCEICASQSRNTVPSFTDETALHLHHFKAHCTYPRNTQTVSISMPFKLHALLRAHCEAMGYTNVSEYVRKLIHEDMECRG